MKPPAIERAVHTTPPMMAAATIPEAPLRPTATIITDDSMSVISVIPDTGLLPTMAMAFAATVVNRKAITATMSIPTTACQILKSTTPTKKKTNVTNKAIPTPMAIIFIGRSRCVRSTATDDALLLPFISEAANPTALRIMLHDRMIPMIPAIAIPPIPMCRAKVENICSVVIPSTLPSNMGLIACRAVSPSSGITGTTTNHIRAEPAHIMAAYLRPMI